RSKAWRGSYAGAPGDLSCSPLEQTVEPAQGGGPVALDGAGGNAEDFGDLVLTEVVVVAQLEHFTLVFRQLVYQLMHAIEVGEFVPGGGNAGGEARVAVVVGAGAPRAVVMPPQVEELAANHDGSQAVEGPHRFGADLAQRVEQTEEGPLQDVVGLLPAAELGEAMEHAAGEHFEAL